MLAKPQLRVHTIDSHLVQAGLIFLVVLVRSSRMLASVRRR